MISSRKSWQEHLGAMSLTERCDTSVYATQWAQDPRWMRAGLAYRRPGNDQNPLRQLFSLYLLAAKR